LIVFGAEKALCPAININSATNPGDFTMTSGPWHAVISAAKSFTRGYHVTPTSLLSMMKDMSYFEFDISQANRFFACSE